MSNLALEEFNKLLEKEKGNRYKDLNKHDQFLVRISMNPGYEVTGTSEISEEDKKWAEELHKQILEQEKYK